MFKVLIWDYTGMSAQWLEQAADMKDIEVVGTIKPTDAVPEILLKRDAWDWLLIFEQGKRDFFYATIQMLRLPPERVIYALDLNSWLQHPKAAFALTNMQRGGVYPPLSELCDKSAAWQIRHLHGRRAQLHRHCSRRLRYPSHVRYATQPRG